MRLCSTSGFLNYVFLMFSLSDYCDTYTVATVLCKAYYTSIIIIIIIIIIIVIIVIIKLIHVIIIITM